MWLWTTVAAVIGCVLIGHVLGAPVGWGVFLVFISLWRGN
jgi:hypothetical protein